MWNFKTVIKKESKKYKKFYYCFTAALESQKKKATFRVVLLPLFLLLLLILNKFDWMSRDSNKIVRGLNHNLMWTMINTFLIISTPSCDSILRLSNSICEVNFVLANYVIGFKKFSTNWYTYYYNNIP